MVCALVSCSRCDFCLNIKSKTVLYRYQCQKASYQYMKAELLSKYHSSGSDALMILLASTQGYK